MELLTIIQIVIAVFVVLVAVFLYGRSRQLKQDLKQRKKEMDRKLYELAILKELGDRIGYSLNVQNIIDVISGSLHQFIDYSAVSYMLLEPEKIIFKVHLEKSVARGFIDETKTRMLGSLSALMDRDFNKDKLEEILSGAILVEDVETPVKSFFNIPLVIGEKVVGILTVAHTESGRYKEEEMTILYKITQQASNAVTRLQEVVETEQRKLNAMVESMTEGVVMTDKDYRILVANPALKKAIGLEDKQDLSIFDIINKLEDKFDIRGKLEESLKLDKISMEPEVFIKDRFHQILVSPVKRALVTGGEEILGGVVIFHDITHDKELEKLREDFTSMLVHELRSPLDNIKKMSQYLIDNKEDEKNKEDFDEFMPLMVENSSNMLQLVNSLLDVAKIESGKFTVFNEPADIKKIIDSRIKFYQTAALDAKVKVVAQLANNLPKQVSFDPIRITQVVNNLLSNALKFTPAGEQIYIQALAHKTNNDLLEEAGQAGISWFVNKDDTKIKNLPECVVVAITNPGKGIAQDKIPQLFSKFVQFKAEVQKDERKGTGLGLVVAKGIVEAHGGVIGIGSEENKGTTFYFSLPLK